LSKGDSWLVTRWGMSYSLIVLPDDTAQPLLDTIDGAKNRYA
jgi:hypothetical protein